MGLKSIYFGKVPGFTRRWTSPLKIEWATCHLSPVNLRALGVDDLTIMEILRHSDVAVTRASYIKAMGKLEAEFAKPSKSAPAAKNVDVVLLRVSPRTRNSNGLPLGEQC